MLPKVRGLSENRFRIGCRASGSDYNPFVGSMDAGGRCFALAGLWFPAVGRHANAAATRLACPRQPTLPLYFLRFFLRALNFGMPPPVAHGGVPYLQIV
jgi:hypothetical protein